MIHILEGAVHPGRGDLSVKVAGVGGVTFSQFGGSGGRELVGSETRR